MRPGVHRSGGDLRAADVDPDGQVRHVHRSGLLARPLSTLVDARRLPGRLTAQSVMSIHSVRGRRRDRAAAPPGGPRPVPGPDAAGRSRSASCACSRRLGASTVATLATWSRRSGPCRGAPRCRGRPGRPALRRVPGLAQQPPRGVRRAPGRRPGGRPALTRRPEGGVRLEPDREAAVAQRGAGDRAAAERTGQRDDAGRPETVTTRSSPRRPSSSSSRRASGTSSPSTNPPSTRSTSRPAGSAAAPAPPRPTTRRPGPAAARRTRPVRRRRPARRRRTPRAAPERAGTTRPPRRARPAAPRSSAGATRRAAREHPVRDDLVDAEAVQRERRPGPPGLGEDDGLRRRHQPHRGPGAAQHLPDPGELAAAARRPHDRGPAARHPGRTSGGTA